jgi:O-antigen/teichoic acid export membrane protein
MGATTIGQVITIAASPALTRLYEPRDFGVMALFASVSAILVAFSTGQYHSAIVLPEDDFEGYSLLAGSVILTAVSASIAFVAAVVASIFVKLPLALALGIAIYVVSLGVSESLHHWLMRTTQFRLLARVRLMIVLLSTGLTLSFGLYKTPDGLIIGAIIGQLIPTAYLALNVVRRLPEGRRSIPIEHITGALRRYKDFPRYSLPGELLNSAAYQMPTLLITRWFDTATTGLYSLTQRVLSMPMALVSRAVLDVFKQRASSDYARDGQASVVFRKTFISLAAIGVPGFLLLALIAPPLFAWVFGPEWREAGEFARILSPMFALRFVASPLSYMLLIADRQRLNLLLQALLLVATGLSLSTGLLIGSVRFGLAAFSASYSLIYVVYLIYSWRLAQGNAPSPVGATA